jgi:hypothetical protein
MAERALVCGKSTNLLRCFFETSNHGKCTLKDLPTLSGRRQVNMTKSKKNKKNKKNKNNIKVDP